MKREKKIAIAVRDKKIPLELQDLFIKQEFGERYGYTPEMVDNLSMRYINGFKTIDLEREKMNTPPNQENNPNINLKQWNPR